MKHSEISTTVKYSWCNEDYIDDNDHALCTFELYLGEIIKVQRHEKIRKENYT